MTGDASTEKRGETTVKDPVGEKVAATAALGVPHVIDHNGSLGGLGRSYPRVSVNLDDHAPIVDVEIVVAWPSPVTSVCQQVNQRVRTEMERLVGVAPLRVNVKVADVVGKTEGDKSRVK